MYFPNGFVGRKKHFGQSDSSRDPASMLQQVPRICVSTSTIVLIGGLCWFDASFLILVKGGRAQWVGFDMLR